MLNNYTYIKESLLDVTNIIDKSNINLDNIFHRTIMQNCSVKDKYYLSKSAIRNGNATYHLSYEFILDDKIYQITLLDNFKESTWTTLDDWENINIFYTDENDMSYIEASNNYSIYHIPIEWFLDEDNLGAMCENEMKYIRPLMRKSKIKKLLK